MPVHCTGGKAWRRLIGFTLVELMITVTIIAILASIAIPKFADMIQKAKEGATKAGLGALRSALSIYYADTEGLYPEETIIGTSNNALQTLTINGKYLSAIPTAKLAPYHADTTAEDDFISS